MPSATLPSKPNAPLIYDLIPGSSPLVVFVNGLGLPAASWAATKAIVRDTVSPAPQMLSYDRFSQGATTSKDPSDSLPGKEVGYGHDMQDVVKDLHELLASVAPQAMTEVVFVAASIGVHIARLYAAQYPGTVSGLLLLDSNIGNAEFTEIWPNPDGAEFKESDVVSEDCDLSLYRESYNKLGKMFDSSAKSPEGLDRRSVKTLLPDPTTPMLVGRDDKGPWITVVGHDPERFAEESLKMMATPKHLTYKYTQPAWEVYNEGLLNLTSEDRRNGVVTAAGCGHFIQKDDPKIVATLLKELLDKLSTPAQ